MILNKSINLIYRIHIYNKNMKPINDKEYKRIYVDRILSKLKNNINKATHMKEIKMIKPKTPINNLGKNSKNDNAFKNQYKKRYKRKLI